MTAILRNTSDQLRHTFTVDGVPTDPDGNAATVTVTRADGTVLQAAIAATRLSTGVYAYSLPPQPDLDRLTVTWTATFSAVVQIQTDTLDIVGGFYVTIVELRALPGLTDPAKVTIEQLVATRTEFEEIAERYTGVSWVPRFSRETHRGGTTSLLLNHYPVRAIRSASTTGTVGTVTAYTVSNWRVDTIGQLVTDGDWLASSVYGEANLTVAYEHGHDSPPESLKRACREYVAATLLRDRSQIPRTVLSVTDPAGFATRYGTIDWDAGRPTGIDTVDSVLNSLGRAAPAIA